MYSAVVLDEASREKIVNWAREKFSTLVADNWEIIAHHMTIKMGELPSYLVDDKGTIQNLEVNGYAFDDKVIAVRVSGYFTTNKIPHVTVAVNRGRGGKPVMSNNLTNWQSIPKPFKVKGVVQELK